MGVAIDCSAMGLLSWLAAGLAAGLLAAYLLPGRDPGGRRATVATGAAGGLSGGVLATVLGFGGILSLDLRSLTTAGLAAALAVLVLRWWRGGP